MTSMKKKESQLLQKDLTQLKLKKDWLWWLLLFQDMDMESLSLKEWKDFQKNAEWFIDSINKWLRLGTPYTPMQQLTQDDLKSIQKLIKGVLNSLFKAGSIVMLRMPIQTNSVHFVGAYNKGGLYFHMWPIIADPISTFYFGVGYLLETCGLSLRRCKECSKIFLKSRRQEYCSKQCSQRIRTKRWYEAHKEDAKEKRRQVYEKEVKKKHPRAKVQRRSPRVS